MIGGEGGDGYRLVDDENQREKKGEKGKRVSMEDGSFERRLKHLKRNKSKGLC